MIGETLGGRYLILRLLGQGGMGAVYEATHTGTGRRVAVKVITAGLDVRPAIVARFEVEARAAGRVESRHIAQVFDVGRDELRGVPYLVMEYLTGEDIQQVVRRLGPLPPILAVRAAAQACRGLEKAHAANIIHRDIKPANLFLTTQEDDTFLVKLLDFGVAKIRLGDSIGGETEGEGVSALTSTGALLGSPLYMSPEQARGIKQIDHRTDLWSVGVVLYQMLCGRTPFQHIEAMGDLIISLCSTPAANVQEFAPWVSPQIAEIVRRSLEIPVDRRFQTAREFYEALKPLLGGSINIDGSMLSSLPDNERSFVAPRTIADTAVRGTSSADGSNPLAGSNPNAISGTSNPGVTSNPGMISAPGEVAGSTHSTAAITTGGGKAAPRRGLQIAVGLAVVAAASAGFIALRGGHGSQPDVVPTSEAATPPPPTPTAAAATTASASAAPTATAAPTASASADASASPAESAAPDASAEPMNAGKKPLGGTLNKGPMPKASAKPSAGPAPTGQKTVDGRSITKDL